MPESSWPENDSYNELESISSLLSDLSESDEAIDKTFNRGLAGRRRKAAVALTLIWGATIALHLFSASYWLLWGLCALIGVHALRVIFARPRAVPAPLDDATQATWPYVSILVAAKNEEAVIGSLVKNLCELDYPKDRYDLWVINDNSSDRTPQLLDQLTLQYKQLQVIHRSAGATGGKSGALNQVWPGTQGDFIAVFDADAQVTPNLLRQVIPLFHRPQVGAVQVRKAILNAATNFWTKGQMTEMCLDAYFQQQRIAVGGIGELRGNGQFVRRTALESCGGWNEETITDDLDLTLRLHINQWDVDCLPTPAVGEEGVTQLVGLWHQRNRWAEGGYQRYLDYWRLIAQNRLGFKKSLDMFLFWVMQYALPTAALPDLLMAIARHRAPVLAPLTTFSIGMSMLGMMVGLKRFHRTVTTQNPLETPATPIPWWGIFGIFFQTLRTTVYMLHWIPVVASTTLRMSIRPKRLKWVKTIHQGTDADEMWMDVSEQPD